MDHGAHFYRCDFQVHTPRDQNWKGADAVTDDARRSYAESLIAAAREKGLAAIAVTDHHDMEFVAHVRRAAAEELSEDGASLEPEKRIVVFPGMELTLGVPCQAILILDADFPENLFHAVHTALAISPVPGVEARNGNVNRLDSIITFSQLHDKLDEHTWLRGRYIVLPNVSGEGKVSLLRDGQHGKYASMPCVGGYVDGSLDKLKPGVLNRLDGRDKNWGNKKIGCFQTSDNRREDHTQLGIHTSWVKWAVPTAEALRQACLAQESRISQVAPRLPTVSIARIDVSNSSFLGPVDLMLNPQYTALIGGRGTGKSTVLEYLRWALCDQPPGMSDEDSPNYQERRARLIASTLSSLGATVDVTFTLNDVAHVVRRNSRDGSVLLKIGNAEMRTCSEAEVRSLLPIQAYSQKQLSNVSVRIDELTRFVTDPIRSELAALKVKGEETADRLRQKYATRQRAVTLAQEVGNRSLAANSLQEQTTSLQASLAGLTPEDRATLDQAKDYAATDRIVNGWNEGVVAVRDLMDSLVLRAERSIMASQTAMSAVESDTFDAIQEEYQNLMADAVAISSQLKAKLDEFALRQGNPTTPWGKWEGAKVAFQESYEAAVQRSSAHKERVAELEQMTSRLNAHLGETARIQEQLNGLQDVEAQYQAERAAWKKHREDYDRLMSVQCQVLTKNSDGTIRATIQRFANAEQFTRRFKDFVSGVGLRRDKLEGLGSAITSAADPGAVWQDILADLEVLAVFKPEDQGTGQRPATPALVKAGLSTADLDKVAARLSSADWLELSLVDIASEPVFEYQSRESEYIPFRNASAGQQATALLRTLLNESGPPLIIDQPEEDLDNPVISEIVEQIWLSKQKRQIIFASHNANLVVNGDAELVVWCDYRKAADQSGGKIVGEGAIDVPVIRDAIKKIMEGGELAFKARREKYGF